MTLPVEKHELGLGEVGGIHLLMNGVVHSSLGILWLLYGLSRLDLLPVLRLGSLVLGRGSRAFGLRPGD